MFGRCDSYTSIQFETKHFSEICMHMRMWIWMWNKTFYFISFSITQTHTTATKQQSKRRKNFFPSNNNLMCFFFSFLLSLSLLFKMYLLVYSFGFQCVHHSYICVNPYSFLFDSVVSQVLHKISFYICLWNRNLYVFRCVCLSLYVNCVSLNFRKIPSNQIMLSNFWHGICDTI